MFYELVAAVVAAVAAGGVVMIVNRFTGRRFPKWAVPVAAGAAMIAFTIWSEYTWADRTANALPSEFQVVAKYESSVWWKPWTKAAPYQARMLAVDISSIQRNEAVPDMALVTLILMERFTAPRPRVVFINCAAPARADAGNGVRFDDEGRPLGVTWVTMPADDPILAPVCEG
jgi:hypothetical protein